MVNLPPHPVYFRPTPTPLAQTVSLPTYLHLPIENSYTTPSKNLALDKYEQAIEDVVESEKLISMADKTRQQLKRDKNINLRVSENTITGLKSKAAKLGLRYQTLANSILHQYATS